jgi:hypothetical protein
MPSSPIPRSLFVSASRPAVQQADEDALDAALAATFPASDPVAVTFHAVPSGTESIQPIRACA